MEKIYGSDNERSVGKGPGWTKFRDYLQSRHDELDVNHILEKVRVKKDPLISYGTIEFTVKKHSNGKLSAYYHVYRRRNTVEFDILIKGYVKKSQLFDLIALLSRDERDRILQHDWEEVWNDYWIDHTCSSYHNLKSQSKSHFLEIKELIKLIDDDLPCRIVERPFIFPKGKADHNETGLEAALRETREETGISHETTDLYFNTPIVQHYVGSDNSPYVDYYYVIYQPDIYVAPRRKLSNVYYSKDSSPRETEGDRQRALVLQLMPGTESLTSNLYYGDIDRKSKSGWLDQKQAVPRLRDVTISHELESDAWIEIPVFSSTREQLEWTTSINPFLEFGIFKRHFSAIMEIHQHITPDFDTDFL